MKNMELRLRKVGHITRKCLRVLVKALPHENPSHVRPPFTVDWRVGITFFVGKLMVNTMRRDPENRATLKCEGPADRQRVLDPFRRLVSTMRQQPVISHSDSQAAGDPPQYRDCNECFPTEKEKCGERADMERHHESGCYPIDLIVFAYPFQGFQFHMSADSYAP